MSRRSNRPPPAGAPAARRRSWWRRGSHHTTRLQATDAGYESSDAAEQERFITEALADLRDMDVREVMTPRVDVVALSIPVHAEDVVQAVRESGHSCFPVVNDSLDDVVGVLYVNDLFRTRRSARGGLLPGTPPAGGIAAATGTTSALGADKSAKAQPGTGPSGLSPIDISRRIRPPYVIPESRRILAALVEMRRHRRSFAIVVDEYGGLAGVLTVKDLLEPIVGDLRDELDRVEQEDSIMRVDASRWLIDGRTNVDEVRDTLGIDVPEGEYVTIAGYLVDGLGHIPVVGESLQIDGWELTVQEMDKRRVATVVARRLEPSEPGSSHPRAGPFEASTSESVTRDELRPSAATASGDQKGVPVSGASRAKPPTGVPRPLG